MEVIYKSFFEYIEKPKFLIGKILERDTDITDLEQMSDYYLSIIAENNIIFLHVDLLFLFL